MDEVIEHAKKLLRYTGANTIEETSMAHFILDLSEQNARMREALSHINNGCYGCNVPSELANLHKVSIASDCLATLKESHE